MVIPLLGKRGEHKPGYAETSEGKRRAKPKKAESLKRRAKVKKTKDKVFTDEAAAAALEVLRKKLGQVSMGLDPDY